MKNFSSHHAVIDENILILDVENQIFFEGENIKLDQTIYKIIEIINPVIRLKVKEVEAEGINKIFSGNIKPIGSY